MTDKPKLESITVLRHDEMLQVLRDAVEGEGGPVAFSRTHCLKQPTISNALAGRKRVSAKTAEALGYELVRDVYAVKETQGKKPM